jgi:hypothetical protein
MGEKFCQHSSDKGLISRIYGECEKLSPQGINTPMKKRIRELNMEFSNRYKWPTGRNIHLPWL